MTRNTASGDNGAPLPVALEDRGTSGARRLRSPSAERNKGPILQELRSILPTEGALLEIGCGTGEHAVHFAAAFPGLAWHTSDPDADARASTAEWIEVSGLPNLRAPLAVDVAADSWDAAFGEKFQAILSLNMIHIAPWAASVGLFGGAGRILAPGGLLILYGPFMRDGLHNAESNAAFDASLKARNPAWGVRDIRDLETLGASARLVLRQTIPMPANNLLLVFAKPEAE